MSYEFTLVLDREPSQAEIETLAAAGLDPIGAEGPHPAMAHLAIDAGTLPAAITTAVRHIESLGIAVTGVQSADLVSLKDIAARTGRSYESVRKLAHGQRGPGGFPAPLSTGQWALYSWAEVSAWLARHYPDTAAAATSYDRRSPPPTTSFAPGTSCPPPPIAPTWHSSSLPDPGPTRRRGRSAGKPAAVRQAPTVGGSPPAACREPDHRSPPRLPTRLHPRRRATRPAAHDPCLPSVP